MITLENIKLYINEQFNVQIENKCRKRKTVYARAIYANLALKYLKKESLSSIANYVNTDHASIIHYRDYLIDVIKIYNPKMYYVYNNFQNINVINYNQNDLKEKYNELHDLYIDCQLKLLDKKKIENTEFSKILDSVPKDKLELFYFRIKPIAKMLNSHITN